ncbi:MAG: SAM-dependent methyltransferase [bacterium]
MPFTLDRVVPWGRSFDEYVRMFHLTGNDLRRAILGCADGPSSFNSEMKAAGYKVVSCDPLYQFTAKQIEGRINETYNRVMEQTVQNKDNFIWDTIQSVEELGKVRMEAMRKFLADYDQGKGDGRYLIAELPALPFSEMQFDLALCSHFLFLYTGQLSLEFHQNSILEMCRVAREVRIFPLIDLCLTKSPYVEAILPELGQCGFEVKIEKVAYEFQRGGNEMMRIFTIGHSLTE